MNNLVQEYISYVPSKNVLLFQMDMFYRGNIAFYFDTIDTLKEFISYTIYSLNVVDADEIFIRGLIYFTSVHNNSSFEREQMIMRTHSFGRILTVNICNPARIICAKDMDIIKHLER